MRVEHPVLDEASAIPGCPESFDAEPYTKISQSAHDVATVDGAGQHPNLADEMAAAGAALTRDQWDVLAVTVNPSWTPTYQHVVLDEPVTHVVADCPNCGTPIKVG